MANTGLDKPRGQYFITYGWSEGPWQGRKMRKALEAHGFEKAKKASEADVIIAHSLGCYLIPSTKKARIIVLIGLPYWPGRPAFLSVLQNTKENLKTSWKSRSAWWLNKLIHNCWYILARPSATYYAMTRQQLSRLPKTGPRQHIILVRNARDMFCHPDIQKMIPRRWGYEYVEVKEDLHEDCWLNPASYVQLMEKYYG